MKIKSEITGDGSSCGAEFVRFESTAEDTASKRALIIRYNRAAISLKISERDGTEFNYCETVAVQGLF